MALTLPQRPADYIIDEILLPNWDASLARGFDPNVSDPSADAFLPLATSIDEVGAVYPSLIVRFSNETTAGQSTYDFLTRQGAGQDRNGSLLATVRVQERKGGYTGDPSQFPAVEADTLVVELTDAVETIIQRNADGADTILSTLGSQRGPDVPDDTDTEPTVRIEDAEIRYSWQRRPDTQLGLINGTAVHNLRQAGIVVEIGDESLSTVSLQFEASEPVDVELQVLTPDTGPFVVAAFDDATDIETTEQVSITGATRARVVTTSTAQGNAKVALGGT